MKFNTDDFEMVVISLKKYNSLQEEKNQLVEENKRLREESRLLNEEINMILFKEKEIKTSKQLNKRMEITERLQGKKNG